MTTPNSTREQEAAWRMQAEAGERAAREIAAELYEALRALVDATDAEADVGEIPALHRYEREFMDSAS